MQLSLSPFIATSVRSPNSISGKRLSQSANDTSSLFRRGAGLEKTQAVCGSESRSTPLGKKGEIGGERAGRIETADVALSKPNGQNGQRPSVMAQ